jgi:hypothetical protein
MALGRQRDRQADMLVTWAELPRSPGHVFYDRLQVVLVAAGFDGFVEGLCASLYAPRRGRPSLPPGRYFRMLLVGYFEGIDSERGLEWRCADSLSLREFLRLSERDLVPDHSWLSRTRSRLPLELHDQVFTWVLRRLARTETWAVWLVRGVGGADSANRRDSLRPASFLSGTRRFRPRHAGRLLAPPVRCRSRRFRGGPPHRPASQPHRRRPSG